MSATRFTRRDRHARSSGRTHAPSPSPLPGSDSGRTVLFGGDPVAQTLLIPLWARAVEQREVSPLLHDPLSSQVVAAIDADWSRIRLSRGDLAQIVVRAREFDRFARDFLARDPAATVVHIGCGLDTRFQRVDNSSVRWYDLDLPAVIDLRRSLVPESARDHYLDTSVFDLAWLDDIAVEAGSTVMFMAEAVLPYLEPHQVRALVRELWDRFPGAELVTDTHTPHAVRMENLHLAAIRSQARMRWSVRDPRELESWAAGIALVESFSYFDDIEPRMGIPAWVAHIPVISHATGIHRYLLGDPKHRGGMRRSHQPPAT